MHDTTQKIAAEAAKRFLSWQRTNPKGLSFDEMIERNEAELTKSFQSAISKAMERERNQSPVGYCGPLKPLPAHASEHHQLWCASRVGNSCDCGGQNKFHKSQTAHASEARNQTYVFNYEKRLRDISARLREIQQSNPTVKLGDIVTDIEDTYNQPAHASEQESSFNNPDPLDERPNP